MSDTPETDKEWRHPASFDGSERVVHISVAQKRERERDEAREELAEAKREAENLAKSIYRSEYSDNDTDLELLDSVAGVISQIDNMYAGVREQRDEARNKMADALQEVDLRNLDFERMKQERDEARGKLAKITQAAEAVIDRWEQPAWKDTEPTGAVIYRLRDALGREAE